VEKSIKGGASPSSVGAGADAKRKDFTKKLPYQTEFPALRTEVRKIKSWILNALLDQKATVFYKVYRLPKYTGMDKFLSSKLTEYKAALKKSSDLLKPKQPLSLSSLEIQLSRETKQRNDKMIKNISCLEITFQLHTCVEEWPNVKISVERYAEDKKYAEYMRPEEKSKHHGGQSDALFKDIKPRDVIDMLKSAFKRCR